MKKKRIYGFVGPTASGKTALSLDFAERTGGEILCMERKTLPYVTILIYILDGGKGSVKDTLL